MTDRTDNFNRADGAIGTPSDAGSAWVEVSGTWAILTNQGRNTSGGSQEIAVLESSVSNVNVQATFATIGTDAGLVSREADNSNYIVGVSGPTSLRIFKQVAASFTQLGSTFSGTISSGDVLKLTSGSDDVHIFSQNGTARVTTAADSAGSTNTKHGLRSHASSDCRFDDFSITAIGGGGTAQGIMFAPSLDGVGSYGRFMGNRPS